MKKQYCFYMRVLNSMKPMKSQQQNFLKVIFYFYLANRLFFIQNSVIFAFDLDNSCKHRYFVFHSTGVHSIYLTWLENLQNTFHLESEYKFLLLK